MFVNSIDLHNNLKNELARIRQGQTCFSVCHDARSTSLIRVEGGGVGEAVGCDGRCAAVNTFRVVALNESCFPLNSNNDKIIQLKCSPRPTSSTDQSADSSLLPACK